MLEGIVISGLGEAEFWIKKIKDIFKEKKRMELFEGTLNIKLSDKYLLGTNVDKVFSYEYGGTQDVLIKECKIFEKKAYIVRTMQNENEKGTQPINIIEIVSDVNFRKEYNLQDGDQLNIII